MPGRPWTPPERVLLRQAVEEGLSATRAVARLALDGYARSRWAVKHKARQMGLRFQGDGGGGRWRDICPRGHDKSVVGRYRGQCAECARRLWRERYHRLKRLR